MVASSSNLMTLAKKGTFCLFTGTVTRRMHVSSFEQAWLYRKRNAYREEQYTEVPGKNPIVRMKPQAQEKLTENKSDYENED